MDFNTYYLCYIILGCQQLIMFIYLLYEYNYENKEVKVPPRS